MNGMNLKRADIEQKMKDILYQYFGIPQEGWTEELTRSNLLSRDFLLFPSDSTPE